MKADCSWQKFDVSGHARKDAVRRIINSDFYAEDLMDTFFPGLHVAGKKFRLLVDLLDEAVEGFLLKWIDVNLRLLSDRDFVQFRLGDVDAHVNLIALKERGNGRVRRD